MIDTDYIQRDYYERHSDEINKIKEVAKFHKLVI